MRKNSSEPQFVDTVVKVRYAEPDQMTLSGLKSAGGIGAAPTVSTTGIWKLSMAE
jgi:hypothetical protein